MYDNGVEVRLVDHPKSQSIRVALNHVLLCPAQIPCEAGSRSAGDEEPTVGGGAESEEDTEELEESEESVKEPKEEISQPQLPVVMSPGPWASRLHKKERRQPEDGLP